MMAFIATPLKLLTARKTELDSKLKSANLPQKKPRGVKPFGREKNASRLTPERSQPNRFS
jgi:hypothetical protein